MPIAMARKTLSHHHIYNRFVLEWPTSARPIAVLARFNNDPEVGELRNSIDLFTQEDADVTCAAAGQVITAGDSLQIESLVEGESFITTYQGVKIIAVTVGDQVELGQVIAQAAGDRLHLIVQNPPNRGISQLGVDNVMNPRDYIYIPQFRVRPLVDNNLRVRKLPSVHASIVGQVFSWHLLEPMEHHGRAVEKIGVEGSWLKVRAVTGVEGYTAAWYLQATTLKEGREVFAGVNPVGVNLDVYHRMGKPPANRLGAMGWVRFGYNVSNWRGLGRYQRRPGALPAACRSLSRSWLSRRLYDQPSNLRRRQKRILALVPDDRYKMENA